MVFLAVVTDSMDPGECSTDQSFMFKQISVHVVVGITCLFSMAGSILIILSYCCFKPLRTRVRLILVHLSLMDFGVALSNFVGDVANFDGYYINVTSSDHPGSNSSCPISVQILPLESVSNVVKNLCVMQGAVALYATLSSVLWTTSLAVYMYLLLVHYRTQLSKYSVWISYVLCYGLPLLITTWALTTNRIGFSPFNTSGWCGPILNDPKTGKLDQYFAVISYDLWIYLTMVSVPMLFIGIRAYLASQVYIAKQYVSKERFWDAVHTMDYKFILIPLAFILLRIWSCINNILFVYIGLSMKTSPLKQVSVTLLYLTGIGDSGQGFANGVLFTLLTKQVRRLLAYTVCHCRKPPLMATNSTTQVKGKSTPNENSPLIPSK